MILLLFNVFAFCVVVEFLSLTANKLTAMSDESEINTNHETIMNAKDALKIYWDTHFSRCRGRLLQAIDTKYMTSIECHINVEQKNILKSLGYKVEETVYYFRDRKPNEHYTIRWK